MILAMSFFGADGLGLKISSCIVVCVFGMMFDVIICSFGCVSESVGGWGDHASDYRLR
mgnify:CR=1 FL=1